MRKLKRSIIFVLGVITGIIITLSFIPKIETFTVSSNIVKDIVPPPVITTVTKLSYRMTYYFPGDATGSGNCTASGKCTKDFHTNSKGWYTYNNKLVVATASSSLKTKTKERTFLLYDELTLIIDGVAYPAIVLDKCGACQSATKIDLFVSSKASGLDTNIQVVLP